MMHSKGYQGVLGERHLQEESRPILNVKSFLWRKPLRDWKTLQRSDFIFEVASAQSSLIAEFCTAKLLTSFWTS